VKPLEGRGVVLAWGKPGVLTTMRRRQSEPCGSEFETAPGMHPEKKNKGEKKPGEIPDSISLHEKD